MSVIRRHTTRVIKNTTEITAKTDTPNTDTVALDLTTSDSLYLGFKKPFASRYFHFTVLNTVASTLSVKYWDGSAFAAVEDLIDQTEGFTKNGFVSWQNVAGWKAVAQDPILDVELYWIQITVGTGLHASTVLQAVLNLFCDDALVSAYYPEIISDTRYYPGSNTDFLAQYVSAKDLVVTRLKQDRVITDESNVLDINEVAIAAVHAAAWIILSPIVKEQGDKDVVSEIWKKFNSELNRVRLDLDVNDSGIIEPDEEEVGDVFIVRG